MKYEDLESNSPDGRGKSILLDDLRLVRAVEEGSIEAWHKFIERYSGLIFGVIRRRLVMEDEDEIRSVYVDILKALYDGSLRKYRGESRLSTWLTVFATGKTLDVFRHIHGRKSESGKLAGLDEFDREVLRLFYIDRLHLDVIVHILRSKGHSVTSERIVESIRRIDTCVDGRRMMRLDYEHQKRGWGAGSAQMLEYLVRLERELEEKGEHDRPDARIIEMENRVIAERVREQISRLSREEQTIVYYRFKRGWTARKIAEKLGLDGQRRVYTHINQIVRKLRKGFVSKEE